MFYIYDVLFLFGILVSSSLALPPCICTRNIKYVCGSDGKTYANKCVLECESSKHNNQITLLRQGRCEDIAEIDPCTACTFEYRPVCGSNGKNYPNKCAFDCEKKVHPELTFIEGTCEQKEACKVTMEYIPVCGSDGKDYPNLSSLECEKQSHPELTYTEGLCKHKEECIVTLDYRPVCGSDGKDYPNPSSVECEKRSNPNLTYTYGVCKKDEIKAGDELTVINPKCICVRKIDPVCASNGVSYNNRCLMLCAGDDLTVVSEGPCP